MKSPEISVVAALSLCIAAREAFGAIKMSSDDNYETRPKKSRKTGSSSSPAGQPFINAGRWTNEEHEAFLDGLNTFGKEWKQIADFIQTRTVVQIRTHAQKYFQKLAKDTGCAPMSTSKKESDDYVLQQQLRLGQNTTTMASATHPTKRQRKHSSRARGGAGDDTSWTGSEGPQQLSLRGKSTRRAALQQQAKFSGGVTPRTVAAATILLKPKLQQKIRLGEPQTPATREINDFVARNQDSAEAILRTRRRSTSNTGAVRDMVLSSQRRSPRLAYSSDLSWANTLSSAAPSKDAP